MVNVFCCLLCIFYCRTTPILKTLGQFENLVFVIMSTRENIRLIARSSLVSLRQNNFIFIGYLKTGGREGVHVNPLNPLWIRH